jgi:nitrile hydratase subunit alpha
VRTIRRGGGAIIPFMSPHEHGHDHGSELSDVALRVRALESLLVDKGLVDPKALDEVVETYETKIGPHLGARFVARAWVDRAFRQRLFADANEAVESLELITVARAQATRLVALENTPSIHNLVVCTLCSCYPSQILGLPPVWYKSAPYRSRAVIDPRGVLKELGLDLPDQVEIRVWDSNSEMRYLVVPEQPARTEGWSEERLAGIVTRDSMIGAAKVAVS